jgi:hypothetical protein
VEENVQQTARDMEGPETEAYTNDDINIDIVVNARGRACLLHNKPFIGTPVWVKYLTNQRKVKFIFDNGTEHVIRYIMDEKMHKLLLNVTKLFLIRVEDGKPVEAFDTTLIKE